MRVMEKDIEEYISVLQQSTVVASEQYALFLVDTAGQL